jgi:plastocyanin
MRRGAWTLAALMALSAACGGGGGGGGTPTAPSNPGGGATPPTGGAPPTTATLTIGSDGRISPATVTIAAGGRVTFVNNHDRPHDMASDPHPSHEDCPPMGQVGFLSPGQSRTSGNFNTARRCGFHDHNDPGNSGLIGSITIQ